jgi:hypothetical protein
MEIKHLFQQRRQNEQQQTSTTCKISTYTNQSKPVVPDARSGSGAKAGTFNKANI